MKKLILATLLFPHWASAHCPIELTVSGTTYCTDAKWLNADKKIQGNLQETTEPTPYLIPMGEIPQKWLYTKVSFPLWVKGDSTHQPQSPANFRIFPYMTMTDGHHHPASYQFAWDSVTQSYVLSALALQNMSGCWSLYWTTESMDHLASSQKILDIIEYANLDDTENTAMASYCTNSSSGSQTDTPMEHEHHH